MENGQLNYTAEEFTADIKVDDYIANFRFEERFMAFCRECPNFNRSWGCPPFDFDVEQLLRRYSDLRIFATKITPSRSDMPISMTRSLVRPELERLSSMILDMERRFGGLGSAYAGECLHCNGSVCRRCAGESCLHPDKVRPSLEAFGFDISLTLSRLFSLELLWGKDGIMPPYLILVTGFFHNSPLP